MKTNVKTIRRDARRRKVRAKIFGTATRPRLAVFRSNTQLQAQIINDELGNTLASVSSAKQSGKTNKDRIIEAAKALTTSALDKKIKEVIFDRGGFAYKGNIQIFADAMREAGLKF